ncbi:MAG: hypothetical protein U1A27_10975 [Phycisphaerae bacterium]
MNRGILAKTLRECAVAYAVAFLGVMIFEVGFVRAMGEFSADISRVWLENRTIRRMVQMLVGYDLARDLTPTTLMAIGLAHPLLFGLCWSPLIAAATRAFAGEIDRGTADLLLTLPVSRVTVYLGSSAVFLALAAPLCLAPPIGIALGQSWFPLWGPIAIDRLWRPALNLYALTLAIGGIATLISAVCVRRGVAVGAVLAVVLASMLILFLSSFWKLPAPILRACLFHYYQPLPLIRSNGWPIGDVLVLLGVALVAWSAGLAWFVRRDIPAA